jgi:hypothetical protein
MGEVHEVSDESGAQLLDHKIACPISERLDSPADNILEKSPCIILAQTRTRPKSVDASFSPGHVRVPVSVELDDECKSSIEPDVVLTVGDQALG